MPARWISTWTCWMRRNALRTLPATSIRETPWLRISKIARFRSGKKILTRLR